MSVVTTYTPKEIRQHRAQVVEALRSGQYRQAQGTLRSLIKVINDESVYGYCCLGVIENVRGCEWIDRRSDLKMEVVSKGRWAPANESSNATTLSYKAMNWLGVAVPDPYVAVMLNGAWRAKTLTSLNDSVNFTLTEIGEAIADQPDDWNGGFIGVQDNASRRNEADRAADTTEES